MRLVRTLIAALALAAVVLPGIAIAGPSVYLSVLHVYESQGTIPACRFSSPQLEDALRGVDTYGAQYFADFTQAIQGALSTRAAGACSGSDAGAGSRPSIPARISGPPAQFGPLIAATSAGVPAPLVLLGVLAAALTAFGAAAGLGRARGWDVTRIARLRSRE